MAYTKEYYKIDKNRIRICKRVRERRLHSRQAREFGFLIIWRGTKPPAPKSVLKERHQARNRVWYTRNKMKIRVRVRARELRIGLKKLSQYANRYYHSHSKKISEYHTRRYREKLASDTFFKTLNLITKITNHNHHANTNN